jgi:ribonucleoside-diphosphate reductase alpha chain
MIDHPHGEFALFVGQVEQAAGRPFEVWVNGAEQPRGLGARGQDAVDGHARQRPRPGCKLKLDALATVADERPSTCPSRRTASAPFPGVVAAAMARGALALRAARRLPSGAGRHPGARRAVQPRRAARPAPTARCPGRSTWTTPPPARLRARLKEVTLPGPTACRITRPCAMWLSGNYPRALDGLARLLSLDMRVLDPAWIGMKLRKLLNYAEPLGDFMAFVPGQRRQQTWPSPPWPTWRA